ncbi:MAG: glycosyltransferase [candidate division NC10 bacterium]|nr:glycosyltransferase [candidate division NC10 bacterium]
MKALRELGVEIFVVTPTPWAPPILGFLPRVQKYSTIPQRDNLQGFPTEYPRVLCLPGSRLFYLYGVFYYLGCLRLVRRLVNEHKIQVIHAHTIMPDGFASVLLGRTLNLPVICTIHGSDINLYPFRNGCTNLATRWALKHVGRLVTVSHRLRENVVSLAGPLEVDVIHNGADPTKFMPRCKKECRRELNLPAERTILLFVGNLVGVKGVEFLLHAFARLGHVDAMLYLVGDGHLRQALDSLANTLSIRGSTVFVGRRPHEEIPLWLSAADCLIMPSLSEGFPTLLPEAMLCRIPIVATDVGGIPELLSHGKNAWMVPRGDVTALARGIETMLSRGDQVENIVIEARRAASAGYTWVANAEKTLAVYRAAIQMGTPE